LAEIERAGGTIGKDRLVRIQTIDTRITQIEVEIDKKANEKEALLISYTADLNRVKELYNK
jgi:hypothetical protein